VCVYTLDAVNTKYLSECKWNKNQVFQVGKICGIISGLIFRCVHRLAKSNRYLHQVCLSVSPSAWNNLAPSGRIFVKFDI